MKKWLIFLMFTSVIFSIFAEKSLVRISPVTEGQAKQYYSEGYDITLYKPNEFIDIILNDEEQNTLRQNAISFTILQTETQVKNNLSSNERDIPGYSNYSQTIAQLNQYAEQYDIVHLVNLGNSLGKQYSNDGLTNYTDFQHEIIALKLSDNPEVEEDEPSFYFFGAHHAREPLSTEVTMAVLDYYLSNYNVDPEITDLINNSQIWFIPIVNPDGQKIVLDQTDVWWRKNIRDNNQNQSFDTNNQYGYGIDGVDLNRNYGYGWGYFSSTDNFEYPTYHGTVPFSEPETQIIKEFIDSIPFVAGISYHTYGGLVLYPWGSKPNVQSPDETELAGLAESMAGTILKTDGSNMTYDPGYGWELYAASGGLDEYAYGNNSIFAYTIELAEEFIPSATIVTQTCANNLQAAKILVSRAKTKCVTGLIKDTNNNPLVAEVFVEGIDNSNYAKIPYQSNALFGRYTRLLPEGVFEVTFSKWGYVSQTHSVIIAEGEVSELNITLEASTTCTLSGTVIDELGMPVPQAEVNIYNSDLETIITDNQGQFLINPIFTGQQKIIINKSGAGKIISDLNLSEGTNNFTFYLNDSFLSDGFDNQNLTWIKTGQWNLSSSEYFSPNKSLSDSPNGNYQQNAQSYCQYPGSINLSECTQSYVSFMTKYDIGLYGEYFSLQVSTNGQTWKTLEVYTGTQEEWTEVYYSLHEYIGQNIYLRFYFKSSYNSQGDGIYIDDFRVFKSSQPVSNDIENPSINTFKVYGNYPNPFNPTTIIRYYSQENQNINFDVFNIKGQKVYHQNIISKNNGVNEIEWQGINQNQKTVSSGIYFYRLNNGKTSISKKMILMK